MAPLNFDALRDSHNVANDLLHSPKVQKALVRQRSAAGKWVYEVSEASLTMLDVCGVSKDVLLLVKEHLQDLQFTLRRVISVGEPDISDKITAYNHCRKKLQKETLKCLHSLKGIKKNAAVSDLSFKVDQNLTVVVEVLRDVRGTAISIVESLLALVSTPWLGQKSAKGFLGTKFMRGHSLYDIDDVMVLQSASKRLKGVETAIENLEVEVEFMFRRLIQTRGSLLNILTNYI